MRKQINPLLILVPYASEPAVFALLDVCVGRLARRKGEPFTVDRERLRHIADWLRAALINDEPWMKNVDDQGRPKKLLKFGSFDAIVREADKAMLKASQRLKGVTLVERDEELVEMLEDGYHVVRLLTPASLDRESAQMQHCIGNGGYDESLNDGHRAYLSLRDPQGKAHATMEIEDGKIIQLQGKQNQPPIAKYLDVLVSFIRRSGLAVNVPVSHLGHVIDTDGTWHPLDNLPEGLTVGADLCLRDTNITALPDGLTVSGYLDLGVTPITKLPDDLSVGGSIDLSSTKITTLPAGFKVSESLYLTNTPIMSLPEGLTVPGNLHLSITSIMALPEGLSVGGNLHLNFTPITGLPSGLSVGGDLHLNNTKITALTDGLTVGGELYLRHLFIAQIPALPDSIEDRVPLHFADGSMSAKEFRTMVSGRR